MNVVISEAHPIARYIYDIDNNLFCSHRLQSMGGFRCTEQANSRHNVIASQDALFHLFMCDFSFTSAVCSLVKRTGEQQLTGKAGSCYF